MLGNPTSGNYDTHDLDGDGDHDLVVVDGSAITVGGSTDGDPTEQEIFVTGIPTSGSYDTSDLDGDGDHDLVVVAGGSFVQANTDNDGDDLEMFVLGDPTSGNYDTHDLDGDGDHDLVVVDGSAITVAGSTDGDPAEQEIFVTGTPTSGSYDTSDLDGDGDHDLVVVAGGGFVQANTDNDADDSEVFVLGAPTSGSYDMHDLDGDGDHDLVVVDGAAITVAGSTDGDPTEQEIFVTGIPTSGSYDTSDLDGDGDHDLVIVAGGGFVQANTDNDADDLEIFVLGTPTSGSYDTHDLDGDGDHDLVVVDGTAIMVGGSTDGDPAEQEIFVTGIPTSGSYDTSDLDGDGDHDLVVVAGSGFVRANTDNDAGDSEVFVLGDPTSGSYDTHDLDGDGDHDLVVVAGWAISVEGSTDGDPDEQEVFVAGNPTSGLYDSFDLDGDGDGDLIIVEGYVADGLTLVTVIDRSGSMSGDKLNRAKDSAKQFVDLMLPGDKIGVVSYSTAAMTDYPINQIQTVAGATQTNAKAAIDALYANGMTSIGAGVHYADNQLDLFRADANRAMLVMSDGKQNTFPEPIGVINSEVDPDIVIHTIGFGQDADATLLGEMAAMRGGSYYYATSADLPQIYAAIAGRLGGLQQTSTGTYNILQDGQATHSVIVDPQTGRAVFMIDWSGSDVDLSLVAPDGSVIDHAAAAADPNISLSVGDTYEIYSIVSPQAGQWEMVGDGVDIPAGGEDVNFYGMLQSSIQMAIATDDVTYTTHDVVHIEAALTDPSPILGASVIATIEAPEGAGFTSEQVTLYDDGQHGDGPAADGVYGNYFDQILWEGSYTVRVNAQGTSNDGAQFERYDFQSIAVELSGPRVIGRHLFYNNSSFDGNDSSANEQDDNAIAPHTPIPDPANLVQDLGKDVLVPSEAATFVNYTCYDKGINGIMVDVVNMPGTLTMDDFEFRVGTDNDTTGWTLLEGTELPTMDLRPGAGVSSSDRVTFTWPDGTIADEWLQVRVLANANTGLGEDDVHYWGSVKGETGNEDDNAIVNLADAVITFTNQTGFDPAEVSNPYDHNRDGAVNLQDALYSFNNQSGFSPVPLIDFGAGASSILSEAVSAAASGSSGVRASASAGEITIDVGEIILSPGLAGQVVTLMASSGTTPVDVAGLELDIQVGDGGADIGGSDTAPTITAIDLLTGTIFDGTTASQADVVTFPLAWQSTAVLFGSTVQVGASSPIAQVTFDTTGLAGGATENLILNGVAGSFNTKFVDDQGSDITTVIVNGTIVIRDAGITVSRTSGLATTEAGGTDTFTVVLDSQPSADVTIGVSSDDTGEGTVSPATLTFTTSNWETPQTVTVTGVDDALDDGDVGYTIVTAPAVSSDAGYNGLDAEDVTATNKDDDELGITVSPTTGLTTTEAGGTDTFTVVLDSQPTADVTIGVSSDDTSEGTVSQATLTFTPSNWETPQTVTVTGVDDVFDDGDVTYTIVTAAAVSSDAGYSGLNPDDVTAINTNDDDPGIVISPTTGLTTSEAGGADDFTVVLQTPPTADVTINLSSSNTDEGTVSPTTLTFTPSNWQTPQTVTVTGVDDLIDDGGVAYTVVTAAAVSSDANYSGMNPADVSVLNANNDTAGISVSPTSSVTTTEAGGKDTFTVVLTSQPTADVTINLSSNDTGEGTVAPQTLTFTAANWQAQQTVTVTGVDDSADDGNVTYTIVTAPAASGDSKYSGMNGADVRVTNTDDDDSIQPLATDGEIVFVPGSSSQMYALHFEWVHREARYDNEVWAFKVDDDAGTVAGVAPGDSAYARTVFNNADWWMLFDSGAGAGASKNLTVPGGTHLAFFIVQDDTNANLQARNPDNEVYRRPLAFFSITEANPDRKFDHASGVELADGSVKFAWEDLTCGGDRDFDDVVFTVREVASSSPAVSTPAAASAPVVPVDLGSLDFMEVEDQDPADGDLWYRVVPAADGILTAEAVLEAGNGDVQLGLYGHYDDEAALINWEVEGKPGRLDWNVTSDEDYFLKLSGSAENVKLRLANLLTLDGTNLTVRGTSGDDTFAFDPASSMTVVINGVDYTFTDDEVVAVSFDAGDGNDTVTLADTAGDELLTSEPGHATFVNLDGSFELEATGFEVLHAYGRRGGQDTAKMAGSPENDKFKSEAELPYAKIYGGELYHRAKFFETVEVHSGGGTDLARLFGTSGDDSFTGQMHESTLRSEGLVVSIYDFSQLVTWALSGQDVAELLPSDLKDELHAKPHKATMFDQASNGDAYSITARNFDSYLSSGTPDGGDKAKLWDSAADDVFEAGEDWAALSEAGNLNEFLYRVLAYDLIKVRGVNGGTNTRDVADEIDMTLLFEGDWSD